MQTRKITIVMADDHPITRDGIRTALSQADDLEIIGEAENGTEALELVKKLAPRILLLDLIMPGPRPMEIEEWVRTNCPETLTLVLTSHDRNVYLVDMMEAGVSGYLNKQITAKRLIGAIRRAAKGEFIFDQEQINRANQWQENVGKKIKLLTKREYQVLKFLSQGMENNAIAICLNISPKTAAYHITNIFTKLQVASRQEATIWALKNLFYNLE